MVMSSYEEKTEKNLISVGLTLLYNEIVDMAKSDLHAPWLRGNSHLAVDLNIHPYCRARGRYHSMHGLRQATKRHTYH